MKTQKSEKMYDGITDVREDLVDRAREPEGKKKRRRWWPAAVAAVLAAAIVSGVVLWPRGGAGDPVAADPAVSNPASPSQPASDPEDSWTAAPLAAYALARAQYPEMVPYPNKDDYRTDDGELDFNSLDAAYIEWWDNKRSMQSGEINQIEELENFLFTSATEFLTGAGAENRVYSPVNVYMALAILAETAGGNSRQQILDLLGVDSMEALRSQANALWRSCYCNDGAVTNIPASSLWLNQDVDFQQSTLDTLAETYYASTFQGEMGSEEYNQALRDWLNEQTGGLLQEQASGLEMGPETVLTLAATICFRAKWYNEFLPEQTSQGTFHASGEDLVCDFMHQSDISEYFWGEKFTAVYKTLDNAGTMWFFLPDEGVAVEELLSDEEVMELLLFQNKWEWKNCKYVLVHLTAPKFDVSSDLDLKHGLWNLGITDVFDPASSDFTPLLGQKDGTCVTKVQHAARVTIDEEGCTAASYTVMPMVGGSGPDDEVDFVLNRPFLFAITNDYGLPLFLGVVNQPV